MMGHRERVKTGSEIDVLYCRRWYGHKAGGATVFVKAKMSRRARHEARIDTQNAANALKLNNE